MRKNLSCAFVTHYPMPDIRAFSGISHFMASYLEKAGVHVHFIHEKLPPPSSLFRLRRKVYQKVWHRGMREDRDPGILQAVSRKLREKLQDVKFDFLLSPGSLPAAYLDHQKPHFFWSDSTFAAYVNYVEGFMDMSAETIWRGHQTEQRAIQKSALALYSSDWAAQSARQDYQGSMEKVKVIPFGANLDSVPGIDEVEEAIGKRSPQLIRLLFLGIEWERKGGPKALRVVENLVQKGEKVRLDIVGCDPIIPESLKSSVQVHGFISKKSPEGLAKLQALLQEAHFLIVLSQAEAFGIVFCEAAAYGLPVIAHRVGGIPSAVREGTSGHLFALGDEASAIAEHIVQIWADCSLYQKLARSARQEFEARLNWPVAIQTFLDEVRRFL